MTEHPQRSTQHTYGSAHSYPELVGIGLVGMAHVGLEVVASETVALWFSGGGAAVILGYLVWRARAGSNVLRAWGFRRDNFWLALRAQLALVTVGTAAMVGYGMLAGSVARPWGFWLTLALYPIWGTMQQFALQNLIARNVAGLVSHPAAVAGVAATLFAASHVPRWPLVSLTLVSGFFFTLVYRRVPNLWAVGIAHGLLGSVAIYLVLREDPGGAIWRVVAGP